MNIELEMIDKEGKKDLVYSFKEPERISRLNIFQLKKLYKRVEKFGLGEEVKAEINKRIGLTKTDKVNKVIP